MRWNGNREGESAGESEEQIAQRDIVLARTPTPGKQPTPIRKEKYDAVREAIMAALPAKGAGLTIKELSHAVGAELPREMLPASGSAMWLTMTVKLDLECRGEIERVPGSKPQRLRRREIGSA